MPVRRPTARFRLTPLEDRTAPAALSAAGGTLTITLGADERLSLRATTGGVTAVAGNGFSGSAAGVTVNGSTAQVAAGSFGTLAVADSAAGASLTFADSGASDYPLGVTAALANPGAGTVTFAGRSGFGANSLSAATSRNVVFNIGSTLESSSGTLTLAANQQAAPTAGSFLGIDVNQATVRATGGGAVVLRGRGGNAAGGSQFGLFLQGGSTVSGGGGGLTVDAAGGADAAGNNHGVLLQGGSVLTSTGGPVSVTGRAGGAGGAGSLNVGVYVLGGRIAAGGAGATAVTGVGGAASGSNNHGVSVQNDGNVITSAGGPVSVVGTAGGAGAGGTNCGVIAIAGGDILAGGAGTLSVSGVGGAGAGGDNQGVFAVNAGSVIGSPQAAGKVSVSGTGGGRAGTTSLADIGVIAFNGGSILGGAGGLDVTGFGGPSDGNENIGVRVDGAGAVVAATLGPVTVTGTGGGGGGQFHHGVHLLFGGKLQVLGTPPAGAAFPLTVRGAGGRSGGDAQGISVESAGSELGSGAGPVSVTGTGGTGGRANTGVLALLGGRIATTAGQPLTVDGTGGTGPAGNHAGVSAQSGAVIATDGGPLGVTGRAGGDPTDAGTDIGVLVISGGRVGGGAVTLLGVGGPGGGPANDGVRVSGAGSRVDTTTGGAIGVTGTGGGGGTGGLNMGIQVVAGGVVAGTTAPVTLTGTGGKVGDENHGLFVLNAGSAVTTTTADIVVRPLAGAGGQSKPSLVIDGGALTAGAPGVVVTQTPTNRPPTIATIPDLSVNVGVTAGPVTFGVGDLETPAAALTLTAASSDPTLVPAGGLVLGGTGAGRTLSVTPAAGRTGVAVITVTVADADGGTASTSFRLAVGTPLPPPPPPAATGGFAAGAGGAGGVVGFSPAGATTFTADPLAGFAGGSRVATADLTGDGVAETIVGAGPGGLSRVVVLDGVTRAVLADFSVFEASFTGGVFVAAADLDGDNRAEVVVTPDRGGGPVVAIYSGAGLAAGQNAGASVARFFGIEDAGFRGGARPALGDVNGDGRADLLVAAGFGGGPRLAIFNGRTVYTGGAGLPPRLVGDFFVFEPTLRNGVFVASGDLTGDGAAEVVVGGGPGGGPRVFALDGKALVAGTQAVAADFFAGDPNSRGGVRVAVQGGQLVTGSGDREAARVRVYPAAVARAGGPAALELSPFGGAVQLDGVYVG